MREDLKQLIDFKNELESYVEDLTQSVKEKVKENNYLKDELKQYYIKIEKDSKLMLKIGESREKYRRQCKAHLDKISDLQKGPIKEY